MSFAGYTHAVKVWDRIAAVVIKVALELLWNIQIRTRHADESNIPLYPKGESSEQRGLTTGESFILRWPSLQQSVLGLFCCYKKAASVYCSAAVDQGYNEAPHTSNRAMVRLYVRLLFILFMQQQAKLCGSENRAKVTRNH